MSEDGYQTAVQNQSSDQEGWFSARQNSKSSPPICRKIQKTKIIPKAIVKVKTKAKAKPKRSVETILKEMWGALQIGVFFPEFSYTLFKDLFLLTPSSQKVKLSRHWDITKEKLEFLGDRVLKMIHGRIAFEYMDDAGGATRLISILESNKVFICYLQKINKICTNLGYIGSKTKDKQCADIFEVIIGAIFYTYFYKNGDYNIIHKIEQWMQQVTVFSEHLKGILHTDLKKDLVCG